MLKYALGPIFLLVACRTDSTTIPPRNEPSSLESHDVPGPRRLFAEVDVEASGLDPTAVARLVQRAKAAESDALVVVVDGRLVVEEYFGRPRGPIEAMSATKSIVALGVGHLIGDGRIESVDTPVHRFFPEWLQGRKKDITIRHLLNHTSGLQNLPRTDVEIYPSPDFVQLAIAAELVADPGVEFSYNNKAVNLLAGVIERASGMRMDAYIGEHVFAPLGIEDFGWTLDDAGNPHAMSGLQISALDLARIGQLLLDGGIHNGKQIIDRAFVEEATHPDPKRSSGRCGLLWWLEHESQKFAITNDLMERWRESDVDPELLTLLAPLVGKEYDRPEFSEALLQALPEPAQRELFYDNTWRRGLPDVEILGQGPIVAFRAEGYLGQHLVIVPSAGLVAVRQKRADNDEQAIDAMSDFTALVRALPGQSPSTRIDDTVRDPLDATTTRSPGPSPSAS